MEKVIKSTTYKGWKIEVGVLDKPTESFMGKLYSAHREINPDNLRISNIRGKEEQFMMFNYFVPIVYEVVNGKIRLTIVPTDEKEAKSIKGKKFFGLYALDIDQVTKEAYDLNLDPNIFWEEIAKEEIAKLEYILNDDVYYYEATKGEDERWGGVVYGCADDALQIAKDELR